MWERTVAVCHSVAAASAQVVVVVLALTVGVAVVILAGRPVLGCKVVHTGLSCGGHGGQRCGWRGTLSIGRGGGNAAVIVGFIGG